MALVLWLGHALWGVPTRVALALFGVWMLKDLLLFPLVRHAYEPRDHVPGSELLGLAGRADDDLDPHGYVRVRHELWRARCVAGGGVIRAGAPVRVRGIEGLTLQVEADPAPETPQGATAATRSSS